MKKYIIKTRAEKKYFISNIIFIIVAALLAAAGILMLLYNIVRFNPIFCAVALLATVAAAAVLVIRCNMGFTSFLAADDEYLYMKSWENGFFSYDILSGAKIVREFIPAKIETTTIPVSEIKRVLIGVPNYIIQQNIGKTFSGMYKEAYDKADENEKEKMKKENIIYISTHKGASCFMPADHLNEDDIVSILVRLEKNGVKEIKCGSAGMNKKLIESMGRGSKGRQMERIPEPDAMAADIFNDVKKNQAPKAKPKNPS